MFWRSSIPVCPRERSSGWLVLGHLLPYTFEECKPVEWNILETRQNGVKCTVKAQYCWMAALHFPSGTEMGREKEPEHYLLFRHSTFI